MGRLSWVIQAGLSGIINIFKSGRERPEREKQRVVHVRRTQPSVADFEKIEERAIRQGM